MKTLIRYFSTLALIAACALQIAQAKKADSPFNLEGFGRLPVQKDGRVKPLDTVARNSLLIMRGKQTALYYGEKVPALQWFVDVCFNPDKADDYKTFAVHHPEVLAMFGFRPEEEKYFSFNELFKRNEMRALDKQLEELTQEFLKLRRKQMEFDEGTPEFKEFDAPIEEIRTKFESTNDEFEVLRKRSAEIDKQFRHIKMGEDINGNGHIDEGEDLNGNGELDPGPNPKKYTTFQSQASKLYGALSLYDQLKGGLYLSLHEELFGMNYEKWLKAATELDTAMHQIDAEGNESPEAMESIQHASLLARSELEGAGDHLSRAQFDQIIRKYRVAMRAARNNANIAEPNLSDDDVNAVFESIQEYVGMYDDFEIAQGIAGRNARFSVLGIAPPLVAEGTANFKTGSDIVQGIGTKFTQDFKEEDQFRIGQQKNFDGIWRDAAVRDKLVKEIISDKEMRLGYPHKGRNPLVDIGIYLLIAGFAYLLWKRTGNVVAPGVAVVCLVIPWILCFGPTGADRKDVHLHKTHWDTLGEDLTAIVHAHGDPQASVLHPVVLNYAKMAEAYRTNQPDTFNSIVEKQAAIFDVLEPQMQFDLRSIDWEFSFNKAEPFTKAMSFYVLAFICVLISWLSKPVFFNRAAFWLMVACLVLHTFGLLARIWIQARPPVTNLYSSAVFIGWGAVVLGVILERIHKNGISSAAGAIVGFVTLIVAHHLSMGGDTMEMMQAVLDTNIWLATHVVVITLGYTAMFLAGILGIVFILRGIIDPTFEKQSAKSISSMVYGITCFAVLFSFVGTMLGGIWADQSWGRFWGWDPKENGALLIVIWSAIVLHCRWAGLTKDRGIMTLSIFGNIVTAWSWFGTNLLQEGLHSYGFSEAGFYWLMVFNATQVAFILIAFLPTKFWRSPWAQATFFRSQMKEAAAG